MNYGGKDTGKFDRFFEDVRVGKNAPDAGRPGRSAGEIDAPRGLPDGEWVTEGVYRTRRLRRLGEPYGGGVLDDPDRMEIMKNFGARAPLAFFDLETTGLSGGTGTYAFLCGIGAVCGEYFSVTQYFLRSPAYERQWLEAVDSELQRGACLVTYNGRAFDVPLLLTRHILARLSPRWESTPHIDLLRYSRGFYRGRLESCSLGSVERSVLSVRRGGEDIPGAMIPGLYLQYLHFKDASPLSGVFYHNDLDIASLASLYCHIARMLGGDSRNGGDLLRAGDIWRRAGRDDMAGHLWDMAAGSPPHRAEAMLRKAYASKKSNDFPSSREQFAAALSELGNPRAAAGRDVVYSVLEELAKLEEHRFRSPARALEYVETALRLINGGRYGGTIGRDILRSLEHRRQRLRNKLRAGRGIGDI
jgi:uncharacterized protein YprB with RNaseH-like and TPR domain